MLLEADILRRIALGEIDLAFRRWRRPTVSAGGRLRTAQGELRIGAVEVVDPRSIAGDEARRAGFADLAALRRALAGAEGAAYRIELGGLSPDRRVSLREQCAPDAPALAAIAARLERWDASRRPGYGRALLDAIGRESGLPASALADRMGVERVVLKQDVRILNEMGLTESLAVGYRLAPRGRAVLAAALEDGR